jgi:hypothetical protein
MSRIIGVLDAFFETGTEGTLWAIIDNDKTGYEALNILKDGDYLFVEGDGGDIVWEGEVKLDYEVNYEPYPSRPEFGQQCVLGYWVHGLQEGLPPETWATWFFESRPAVLLRGIK